MRAVVDILRQDDLDRHELIADAVFAANALAFEAERLSRACALRNIELDAAGRRRDLDAAAEDRFVYGDRQLEQNVVAVALEFRMLAHLYFDKGISGLRARRSGRALAFQPQRLAVGHAFRHGEVEHAAIRQCHALFGAKYGFEKIDLKRVTEILPAVPMGGASTGPARTEDIGKDVGEAEIVEAAAGAGRPSKPRAENGPRWAPAARFHWGRRGSPLASISPASYWRRFSGSLKISLAAVIFLNRSQAPALLGLTSGWLALAAYETRCVFLPLSLRARRRECRKDLPPWRLSSSWELLSRLAENVASQARRTAP